jgi:A/G-specific adenine glycosylase
VEVAVVAQDTPGLELKKKIAFIQEVLLKWYELHGRKHLPWRGEDLSAFHKLLAEILLQKTKAENIVKVYTELVKRYPDPASLAAEDENRLASFLKPLGLYRNRAKNLIRLAKIISSIKEIPCDRSFLEKLPGVGPYIANAFLLSVCNKRTPLVDTNIRRLLTRVFSLRVKRDPRRDPEVWDFVEKLLPERNYREFAWALLDLAALTCRSKKPKCQGCPINTVCDYYNSGREADL